MRIKETVLYYTPEKTARTTKLKGIFVCLGLKIRNIGPEDLDETVGYLAGLKGYESSGRQMEEDISPISEEMLVMNGFSSARIDALLLAIRKAGLPKINLKAIVTEQNARWTFRELYREIKKEHEAMSGAVGKPKEN